MKLFVKFLMWAIPLTIILAAHFTAIPMLVTIATALYWIISVFLTLGLAELVALYVTNPDETKKGLDKASKKDGTATLLLKLLQSFTSMGVYAVVGWAWPFAIATMLVMLVVSVRFNDKDVD